MTSKTKLDAVASSTVANHFYQFAVESVMHTADALDSAGDHTDIEFFDRMLLTTQRALCVIHLVRV